MAQAYRFVEHYTLKLSLPASNLTYALPIFSPPGSAQPNASKPPPTSLPSPISSGAPASLPNQASPKKPGTPGASSLAQTLQARSALPVSAPAFVPAAVAAAQRAALNAWGGITPGKGGGGDGASPVGGPNGTASVEGGSKAAADAKASEPAKIDVVEEVKANGSGETSGLTLKVGFGFQGGANSNVNVPSSSAPGTPVGENAPSTTPQPSPSKLKRADSGASAGTTAISTSAIAPLVSRLPTNINAAPFVPKSSSLIPTSSSSSSSSSTVPSRIANVNAAPFVPTGTVPNFYQRSKSSPGGGYAALPGQGGFNPGVIAVRGEGAMSPRLAGGLVHGQGGSMGNMGSPRGVGGPGGMGPFDVQRRQMSQFHQQVNALKPSQLAAWSGTCAPDLMHVSLHQNLARKVGLPGKGPNWTYLQMSVNFFTW